jgi:hypothetical protein
MLRLAGRARLSEGGREIGDWLCEPQYRLQQESWCLNTVQSLQELSKQSVDSWEGQMYFYRNLCKA